MIKNIMERIKNINYLYFLNNRRCICNIYITHEFDGLRIKAIRYGDFKKLKQINQHQHQSLLSIFDNLPQYDNFYSNKSKLLNKEEVSYFIKLINLREVVSIINTVSFIPNVNVQHISF